MDRVRLCLEDAAAEIEDSIEYGKMTRVVRKIEAKDDSVLVSNVRKMRIYVRLMRWRIIRIMDRYELTAKEKMQAFREIQKRFPDFAKSIIVL